MSRDQLHDEKLLVQKTLLQFEGTFGHPVSFVFDLTIWNHGTNCGVVFVNS